MSAIPRIRPRPSRVIPAGLTLVLSLTLAASLPTGAAFSSPQVINQAGDYRVPQVGDIAGAGKRVAVTWTENWSGPHGGDKPNVMVRASDDRGATWTGILYIEPDEADEPSVAICGRHLFVAYAVDLRSGPYPKWWAIILYHRDLVSNDEWSEQISGINPTRARFPDVACGGDRVWVSWDDVGDDGKRHAFLTHSKVGPPGSLSFATAIDLGRTRPSDGFYSGPSVAAVKGRGYVAWGAPRWGGGSRVRFKRFVVGAGPAFAVTAKSAQTLHSAYRLDHQPELAAHGTRVAVTYPVSGGTWDSVVRVSSDRGVSFKSPVWLRNPGDLGGFPMSIAVRGSRIVVIVSEWYEGAAGNARFVSGNGGASFTRTWMNKDKGFRVAAFVTEAKKPKLVEAWDGLWYNVRNLRFRREE